ncbi:MAG: hypoxanthine phosphoribosyltransferase [Planctomycetes bacterium]|nr:hypoxanthine phosphoribosyltransferase [Planctomycetota bacterium]
MPEFEVLIGRDRIHRRIAELAAAILARHADPRRLCVVAVMDGARVFCDHLVPQLGPRIEVRAIRAKSYVGTNSCGTVALSSADAHQGNETLRVTGRDVLVVEDIVDTGRTVARLREHFLGEGARSVEVVTLLSKPSRREVDVPLDFVGFEIEDRFVIGFGMDFDGRYLELAEIVVYDAARVTQRP